MNEHDRLFKEIESIRENALDFIQGTVPREVLDCLDLETLTLTHDSFVDEELAEHFADLVYSCATRTAAGAGAVAVAKIAFLLEHKSCKPDDEWLQLLRYMVNIWRHEEKDGLPPSVIIPLVFYHGVTAWEARPFHERFPEHPAVLRRFLPAFEYLLTDLGRTSDEAIRRVMFRRDFNITMSLLFKYIHDQRGLLDRLTWIFEPVRGRLTSEDGLLALAGILTYLLRATEINVNELAARMAHLEPEGGEHMISTAMKLHEEGLQEGLQKGRQEGRQEGLQEGLQKGLIEAKREDARRMLELGAEVGFIEQVTGLSREEIAGLGQ